MPAVAGLAATIVAALPASAHEGHHETLTVAEQVRHLFSQPDHLLALAGLVVLAVIGTWQWRRAKARK
ncbi:MAG: HupE/UreJ family protein [Alphaproteobacteria bacterium]|nr:HupE/UreJ family protein [Alphaproteobacteria bacterium]MBU1515237.1 HupE/UreJ family protein [Alphaproteobacteria bacterium]MBU2092367.1 HupE/UreJ family protein [Alphaproteobacteria bacterium]MBU2152961.1 HupE/UreJ family protein [Alphaproteobacteria bacterium]MBU2305792.1 HupE/UreJ family protein [Alphaproteobacteria bacterium]